MRTPYALLLAPLLLLGGCRPEPVLGFLRPLSGDDAMYGRSVDEGVQLAVAQAERAHLLPADFVLIVGDTGSSAATTVAELERLLAGGVRMLIGGVTPEEAAALLPRLEEHDLPAISPTAGWPSPDRSGSPLFRLWPTLELEARTVAYYLREKLGLRRALVVIDGSPASRVLEAEFRQQFALNLKGRVVGTIREGAAGWEGQLVDLWHANDPQAVFLAVSGVGLVRVLSHLEDERLRAVRATSATADVHHLLSQHAALLENLIFPLAAFDLAAEETPLAAFAADYQEAYGHPPDPWAAHGYDAARLALAALGSADAAYRHELVAALRAAAQDFPGAAGVITFNDLGEVRRWPTMHCVRDGSVLTCRAVLEADVERARSELVRFLERSGATGR